MGGNCCRAEFEIRPAASLSMGPSFAEHQIASRFLIIAPRKLMYGMNGRLANLMPSLRRSPTARGVFRYLLEL